MFGNHKPQFGFYVGPNTNCGSIAKNEKQLRIAFHVFLLSLITDNFTILFPTILCPSFNFPTVIKKPNKLMVEGCCRSITPTVSTFSYTVPSCVSPLSHHRNFPTTTVNYCPHNLKKFFLVSVVDHCN